MEQVKIKIKHQSGSKAGQVETFDAGIGDLKIGRGNKCPVQYDPDLDDMVSREHASISTDGKEADTYWIEDHNSSNGLFVNGKQVWGKVKIYAGDTVQVGKNGPTFTFDLDPRPESHIKKTQVINIPPQKPTTVHKSVMPESANSGLTDGGKSDNQPVISVKQGVGKETVQRMVHEERKKTKTGTLLIAAGILVLVIAGGVALHKSSIRTGEKTGKEVAALKGELGSQLGKMRDTIDIKIRPGAKTPTQIAEENSNKVVLIEMAWKLIFTTTGEDLVHRFITTVINGQKVRVGVFQQSDNGFEPMLITRPSDPNADYEPVRGAGSGTGFVVAPDGFILTNRHVAASWLTSYSFPENTFPGVVLNARGEVVPDILISPDMVGSWVPANAMNINNRNAFKVVEGANMYLDVTFARNDLRIPARVVRISNKHDVAMVKIELPDVLPVVDLFDNYNEIKTGNAVTVMGYPGVSPSQYTQTNSYDYFNSNPQIVRVPVPTLSQGNIGRLIKGSAHTETGNYYSSFGDSYQLTINSTGAGNSGGPMFDDQGRVIGIFNASAGTMMTFAVPVKYGMELMGIAPVIDSK